MMTLDSHLRSLLAKHSSIILTLFRPNNWLISKQISKLKPWQESMQGINSSNTQSNIRKRLFCFMPLWITTQKILALLQPVRFKFSRNINSILSQSKMLALLVLSNTQQGLFIRSFIKQQRARSHRKKKEVYCTSCTILALTHVLFHSVSSKLQNIEYFVNCVKS